MPDDVVVEDWPEQKRTRPPAPSDYLAGDTWDGRPSPVHKLTAEQELTPINHFKELEETDSGR